MTVTVQPIRDDLTFGARVTGVTRDQLEDEGVRARLNEAFEAHGLLIFEGVEPTPEMQVAVSTVFGPKLDRSTAAPPFNAAPPKRTVPARWSRVNLPVRTPVLSSLSVLKRWVWLSVTCLAPPLL